MNKKFFLLVCFFTSQTYTIESTTTSPELVAAMLLDTGVNAYTLNHCSKFLKGVPHSQFAPCITLISVLASAAFTSLKLHGLNQNFSKSSKARKAYVHHTCDRIAVSSIVGIGGGIAKTIFNRSFFGVPLTINTWLRNTQIVASYTYTFL